MFVLWDLLIVIAKHSFIGNYVLVNWTGYFCWLEGCNGMQCNNSIWPCDLQQQFYAYDVCLEVSTNKFCSITKAW